MRYAKPEGADCSVLELGCGAGANIPFFESLSVHYHAVEGSPIMVERLKNKYSELKENIACSDFTEEVRWSGPFDLVVDRGALTHNTTRAIEKSLSLVCDKLKTGGMFIGIDWFSMEHSNYRKGSDGGDKHTRTKYPDGSFANLGRVHFSNKEHLEQLFRDFTLEVLEHKTVRREIPAEGHIFASWNMVDRKE